jgi:hypothetical protein
MPARINSNWRLDSFPTSSVRSSRSSVTIWDVLATESLGRPVTRAGRTTLRELQPNPWDQEGWPSTHALGRLPFNVFKCTSRRGRKDWIGVRVHRLADSIHRLSHGVWVVTRDVFGHGFRINLAS